MGVTQMRQFLKHAIRNGRTSRVESRRRRNELRIRRLASMRVTLPDGSSLKLSETTPEEVLRVWLAGPQAKLTPGPVTGTDG